MGTISEVKAKLYKTAIVKNSIYTHNGENDLLEGQHVGVRLFCLAWNALYRRPEYVFEITLCGGKKWGNLYESSLKDFAL